MKIHNHHVRGMWVFLQVYIKEDTFHFVVLISNKVNVVFVFFSRYWIKYMYSCDSFYFVNTCSQQ